jgi:fatty-acid peroxygenase
MSREMPHDTGIDSTLNLLKDGYLYIMNRTGRFDSDVFDTRLLGQQAICMIGEEAARIFYDEEKFKREGAAPNRVKQTLFGEGGVQGMDGKAHKNRKRMFMNIMSKDNLEKFRQMMTKEWEQALEKWESAESIKLYEESQKVLTRAATIWAGVPADDLDKLTEELVSLFESPASLGPPHWVGRRNRNKLEKWMKGIVKDVRKGTLEPEAETALYEIAWHRDLEGELLDEETAAVEVINIIRPIVANAVYINFLVLALNDYPEEKEKLQGDDPAYDKMFIQEVRRFYPFFPFATAVVRRDFLWNGYEFKEGTLTLLDLYGTNHDPRSWDQPDSFRPERFRNWEASPFAFIPQGGGDGYMGHRCAGEYVTLEVMKIALDFLARRMEFDLPEQDLELSMNDIPITSYVIHNNTLFNVPQY